VIRGFGFIGLLVAFASACHGAFEEIPTGARALAMCNATTALSDVFSLCTNPAALGLNDCLSVATFATRLFDDPDLTLVCGELNVGRFGLSVSSLGSDMYRETDLSAGCGFSTHNVSLGASVKKMALSIAGYGSAGTLGLDVGVLGLVSRRFTISATGKNINLPLIGTCGDPLPVVVKVGSASLLADDLLLCVDLAKEGKKGVNISLGQEFSLNPSLVVRAGLSTDPRTFAGGFGLALNRLSIDYAVMMHDPLGLTHGLTFCYKMSRR